MPSAPPGPSWSSEVENWPAPLHAQWVTVANGLIGLGMSVADAEFHAYLKVRDGRVRVDPAAPDSPAGGQNEGVTSQSIAGGLVGASPDSPDSPAGGQNDCPWPQVDGDGEVLDREVPIEAEADERSHGRRGYRCNFCFLESPGDACANPKCRKPKGGAR